MIWAWKIESIDVKFCFWWRICPWTLDLQMNDVLMSEKDFHQCKLKIEQEAENNWILKRALQCHSFEDPSLKDKFSIKNKISHQSERCHDIRSSATDIRIPDNSENSEYIWCIDVNTRILSVPRNFKNFQHIWWRHRNPRAPSDLSIDGNALNLFKIFKILGYRQNSGIHLNAVNLWEIFGYWQNSSIRINAANVLKMIGYCRGVGIDVYGYYDA